MLQENLLKIYETSFRENREMSALTDYFKGETFSYYEMAKEIAKLHLLFKKAGIKQGDKIALIGFGSFAVAKKPGRTGRNPRTGASIKIAAKNVVKFKAGAELNALVK